MESFSQSAKPLHAYAELLHAVQEYALALLVEKMLEGEHRSVKCVLDKIGRHTTMAFVCAQIRKKHALRMLDVAWFRDWLCTKWSGFDRGQLLEHTHDRFVLKRMTVAQKNACIYLSDIKSQYTKNKLQHETFGGWQKEVQNARCKDLVPITAVEKLAVEYTRCRLDWYCVFSLSRRLFVAATTRAEALPAADIDLATVLGALAPLGDVTVVDVVFSRF